MIHAAGGEGVEIMIFQESVQEVPERDGGKRDANVGSRGWEQREEAD